MLLMTKEIEDALRKHPLHSQDGKGMNAKVIVKFFGGSAANWLITEGEPQPNGDWLLTIDDMIVELAVTDFMAKALVTRTTRYKDFDFSPIAAKEFRNKADEETDAEAAYRDSTFWAQHREVELSESEKAMGSFLDEIEQQKG
jgi:hypothetical protein